MDYENFKEQFMQDVKDRLSDKGLDVNVSLHEMKCPNLLLIIVSQDGYRWSRERRHGNALKP